MNPSENTNDQQGDPNWATENWDNPGAVGGLDQTSRPYSSNRLEWEWDPMILAQHPGGGGSNEGTDGDRKSQMTAGTMSSLRAYNNMLVAGLPSNFIHNPMGIFSSSGIRSFGAMESSGNNPTTAALHNVLGSSGIPGIAASGGAGGHGEMRSSYDQRRREFFAASMHDQHVVKREEVCDGHGARIGLNLGVRTYFSTEDTAAGRLGKRLRANSPGSQTPMCQAEGCKADLSTAKHYHRRHKVCELHSKAPDVIAGGHTQRFCQQCSRFHLLAEFDEGKRSCRKRLADHNRRRRKPQPSVSTGCTMAESIAKGGDDGDLSGSNRASDPKSMLMHLKKSGSPSSASLEDSDEKPGSAGNNLQLRTSGATYGRTHVDDQHITHNGRQMSSQPMTGSNVQALLSAISLSPPVPLMLQNAKRQLTMVPGGTNHGQDTSAYQQYLQGVGVGQTGPNLSLSSLGVQLGLGNQPGARDPAPGESYNGMEPHAPWLRPMNSRADLAQGVSRTGPTSLQHLMSTDSKSGKHSVTSVSANSSNSQDPDRQVFSPSNQNLLAMQTSSPESPEWMLGSLAGGQNPRDGSTHFGASSSLRDLSARVQLEGHQMLALLETSTMRSGEGPNSSNGGGTNHAQGTRGPLEFLQQHNTGTENGGEDGPIGTGTGGRADLKTYIELQAMRPYGPPSIYDSHHNLL